MESTRFPNKPLKTLLGRPIIDWVYKNCLQSKFCKEAIIATDSDKIIKHCETTNKKYVLPNTVNINDFSNKQSEFKKKTKNLLKLLGDKLKIKKYKIFTNKKTNYKN